MKVIINSQIVTECEVLNNMALIYSDKIDAIVPESQIDTTDFDEIIDAEGYYLSPGFIDIHKHGAFGYDFMDADNAAAKAMLKKLANTGVTSVLPSTMTMSKNDIRNAMEKIGELMSENYIGTRVLGCHMEGPFISPDWGGAQPKEYIVPADYSLVAGLEDVIRNVTVAPEEPGNMDFIKDCISHGIKVSLGHSLAHYEQAIEAFSIGANGVTHTFNAMHQIQHREPGIICASSECPDVFCELISDNIHVHPATQRLLLKIKGIDHIILITDSMRFAGMGYGVSELAGQRVTINETGARLDNGVLAGSVLDLNNAVLNFKLNNSLSVADAIKPVTSNPAKFLGIYGQKGSLTAGSDADFAIFDENIRIRRTIIGGQSL